VLAFGACVALPRWRSRSSDTPAFLFDRVVTILCEIRQKDRWQIELFFKALKQNLKIKTFVGASANALKVQVWTALIAMLLLKHLQLRARVAWSLANLVARLRMNLFTHRDLWTWLDQAFQGPPTVLTASQGALALG
jgi:hypothetical protein